MGTASARKACFRIVAATAGIVTVGSSCAGVLETQARAELAQVVQSGTPPSRSVPSVAGALADTAVPMDGKLAGYVAYALKSSPTLRSAYLQWIAAAHRISRARRLPEPTLTYGYFIRNVETRVGPQRHRFGLSQSIPWPTKLSAGSDAAASLAQSQHYRFDALMLAVAEKVAHAFWNIWQLDEENRLMLEHDQLMETLAGTIEGRVASGQATLAQLNQVNLKVARHHDHHAQHHQARRAAEAKLLTAIGAPAEQTSLPVVDHPQEIALKQSEAALRSAVRRHPALGALRKLSSVSSHRARAATADRYPNLKLAVDYIETGNAADPLVRGSGTDPLIVSLGVSLPLWQSSYAEAAQAEQLAALARQATAQAAGNLAQEELTLTLTVLRDADRRIALCRGTLIPQAETTFQSVLGSYQTGRSAVAASLMAQRDLLELQLELARIRGQRARAWATLQRVVGHPLDTLSLQADEKTKHE